MGDGDLAKLLNEDSITSQINALIHELDSASGTVHKISQNLLTGSRQINEGNGIINKLLYDSVFASDLDKTMNNLNQGLDQAKDAAETIDDSWILNVFSKKKNKNRKQKENMNGDITAKDDSLKINNH